MDKVFSYAKLTLIEGDSKEAKIVFYSLGKVLSEYSEHLSKAALAFLLAADIELCSKEYSSAKNTLKTAMSVIDTLESLAGSHSFGEESNEKLSSTFSQILPLRAYLLHWSVLLFNDSTAATELAEIFVENQANFKIIEHNLPYLADFAIQAAVLSQSKKNTTKVNKLASSTTSTVAKLFKASFLSANTSVFVSLSSESIQDPLLSANSSNFISHCKTALVENTGILYRTVDSEYLSNQ